jgi:branched-chain amino acid transport system substrate-binding protein
MKKKLFGLLAILIVLVAYCAMANAASPATGEDGIVKIGFLAFISGADTYLGVPPRLAMQDYIDELNANGGFLGKKIELVTYDITLGVQEVVPAATKMVEQDRVIAIIGPTSSGHAIAANPVVTEAGVPLIATSATNEKVTVDENGALQKWMFRVCIIDPAQAEALAGFSVNDLGFKKIAILCDVTQAYTTNLEKIFIEIAEREGGTIVDREGFNENDMEFRAQLTKIKTANPDAIFLSASNYRYGTLVAQQAAELGITIPLLMPDAVYAPELLETAGAELEGSYVSTGILDDDPAYQDFQKQFAAKHPGEKANMFVYYSLDALMALEYCVKKANSTDPATIRDELEHLTNAPVFTGTLTIDPSTHNPLDKPVTMMRVTNNEFEFYKNYQPTNP